MAGSNTNDAQAGRQPSEPGPKGSSTAKEMK